MTGLPLDERAARTIGVLDRFRDRAFDWNGASCIHLAHAQAEAMGHVVPRLGPIRSALGAKRALLKQGFDTVPAMLNALFVPITPLAMLVGDICAVPGEDDDGQGFPSLWIGDGQGNLFGWHAAEPDRMVTLKFALADITGAWRL